MSTTASPASADVKKKLIIKTAHRRSVFAESTALAGATAAPVLRNNLSPMLKFERRTIASLKGAKRRVRKENPAQVRRLVNVIKRVGLCAPILIDRDAHVIDGHAVVAAAKALEIGTLVCGVIEHLSEAEIEFLKVALNRVSECGEWDLDELRPVLLDLRDQGFVLEDTGFSIPELDAIVIGEASENVRAPSGDEQFEPAADPVSRVGDLWLMNEHQLFCGDATNPASFAAVLGGSKAQAVFTDPPWNIPIKGFVSSQHDDFKMGAGEMSNEAFAAFIRTFTGLAADALETDGVMFTCIDWRSFDLIVRAGREAGLTLINTAVWNKGSGGMGGLYRSAHELIPVFCKGKSPRVNNVALGKHGRDRTNVWSYPGANRRGSSAGEALKDHPTPKPVDLVHDAIIDVTSPGEIVLDPFLGSGTTLLAAQQSGRVARCIELDPVYVDVSIRRWEAETGAEAVHSESRLTFAQLREMRCGEDDGEGTDND